MTHRRAIIVAAGRGSRLGDATEEIPKCMVQGGRPADPAPPAGMRCTPPASTTWWWCAATAGDLIDGGQPPAALRREPGVADATTSWPRCSTPPREMDGGLLLLVLGHRVRARGGPQAGRQPPRHSQTPARALVVDRRWHDAYVGRTLHPVPEAELAAGRGRETEQRITRVGKLAVTPEEAAGEFIGLAWFSADGRPGPARGLAAGGGQRRPRSPVRSGPGPAQRLPDRRPERPGRGRPPPGAGVHRRPVARDRHRPGSGRGRADRRRLALSHPATTDAHVPDRDPSHWLYRLDPSEWLAAAATRAGPGRRRPWSGGRSARR